MRYDTINTKVSQLTTGWTKVGSGSTILLLMGSCRSVPYLNFLEDVNRDNRFTIVYIDPFNWNYDTVGNQINLEDVLEAKQTDGMLLELIRHADVFLHEHFQNFGMFNTDKECAKHIYQFGMAPALDLVIPNYNNHFILFQDLVNFHQMVREAAAAELAVGPLSQRIIDIIVRLGLADIDKFVGICFKSSFPEFGDLFRLTWRTRRYWWTCNHVTSRFTTEIFLMACKRIGIDVPAGLVEGWIADDPYSTHHTPMTPYDQEHYGIAWPEQPMPLKPA